MAASKLETGRQKTGGRQKGTPNKRTQESIAKVKASGLSPLDYMLSILHSKVPRGANVLQKIAHTQMRFEAAKAAAPYVHSKLASVEHKGVGGGPIEFTQITRKIVRPEK